MNINRRLPLALLIAGIVILLSSCNAMLDAIYPERQIIDVHVQVSAINHSDFVLTTSFVNVQLTDSSGYTITGAVALGPTSVTGGYVDYYITFTKLKNQSYGLSSYYYGSGFTYYPFGSYPGLFEDPSGLPTYQITLPYYQSSDITNLTVSIP